MLVCKWMACSQKILPSFQRQKLEAVEEENRRQTKTVQGKHLSCGFDVFIHLTVVVTFVAVLPRQSWSRVRSSQRKITRF